MKCPKCNHTQANATECRKCGVIFAKYEAFERRKKEAAAKKARKSTKNVGLYALIFSLMIVTAATTYYLVAPKTKKTTDHSLQTAEETAESTYQNPEVLKNVSTGKDVKPAKKQKNTAIIAQASPVGRARSATVSIETPWGTGSGFFITKNYIVTNKHVVEFDTESLRGIQEKVATRRKLIELEKEKLTNLRSQMRRMSAGPTKSQLEIIIREREKSLAHYIAQQQEGEQRLAELEKKLQAPDIKVILEDGQEHYIGYVLTSPNYDLALLALFAHDGTYLRTAPQGMAMQQGDKVFTVGSPVGLRHTVTSGVFSGFRRRGPNNQLYLQTDAAINPGNSGGPLIDEKGYVHGVNTMIIKDTEGIGFAIPIEKVYEEFSSTLR